MTTVTTKIRAQRNTMDVINQRAFINTVKGEVEMLTHTIAETVMKVSIKRLGVDALDVDLTGMTDMEVLKAIAEKHPIGVTLASANQGPVWVNPKQLLNLAMSDGFGLELIGLAHTAAELLRVACDLDRADALGGRSLDRLMLRFARQAQEQAKAKRVNQLHAHRWGGSSKVIGSDRVEPNVMVIHPDGPVARMLCDIAGIRWDDRDQLEGRPFFKMRSPFILGAVMWVEFDTRMVKHMVLLNRLDFRKITKGK